MKYIKSLYQLYNIKDNLNEEWISYLYNTKEKNYNILNVKSLREINKYSVLKYVIRTLEILDEINKEKCLDNGSLYYIEETLKWSDVAKTGSKHQRMIWKKKKYDLYCHNIGSYQIYSENNNDEIVSILIKTHGLIGQYIKGEVNLNKNIELYNLVKDNKIEKDKLREILIVLNKCIISAISKDLYDSVESQVKNTINKILNGEVEEEISIVERFNKLNKNNLSNDDIKYLENLSDKVKNIIKEIFKKIEIWYFEGGLKDFNIKEQVKILLLSYNYIDNNSNHLTFESLMKILYLDYKDKREINIYKRRIIETYLKEISIEDIINNNIAINPHISYKITIIDQTLDFNFKFSLEAKKLIEFCEVACKSNSLYQKATYMLYDLFGFRRDEYDRFYNELDYLETMNNSLKGKAIILDYVVGNRILDVGPGGGALLDLLEKTYPNTEIYGLDLSQNVIDSLTKKKKKENHTWNIIKGDALQISKYFKEKSIDTIIYSSIIHELYSYIKYDGKLFNKETIKQSLKEAYKILPKGGRIIIRDGIMSEPKSDYRLIEFKNIKDIEILNRYCNDFKGRKITYDRINENTVKMKINDAMEFLFTYTWGEESYPLEVKEQFGYFTINEYVNFLKENLENCNIVESKSFLQKGYENNLLKKITIYDENKNIVKLPDSTSIIVVEKG